MIWEEECIFLEPKSEYVWVLSVDAQLSAHGCTDNHQWRDGRALSVSTTIQVHPQQGWSGRPPPGPGGGDGPAPLVTAGPDGKDRGLGLPDPPQPLWSTWSSQVSEDVLPAIRQDTVPSGTSRDSTGGQDRTSRPHWEHGCTCRLLTRLHPGRTLTNGQRKQRGLAVAKQGRTSTSSPGHTCTATST